MVCSSRPFLLFGFGKFRLKAFSNKDLKTNTFIKKYLSFNDFQPIDDFDKRNYL